jgi:esterase/lipase
LGDKHGMIDETGKHGVNYKHGMNDIHNTGCLIIHGFGGNYDEVSPLANRLEKAGYKVVCPALAGHTGRRSDLRKRAMQIGFYRRSGVFWTLHPAAGRSISSAFPWAALLPSTLR